MSSLQKQILIIEDETSQRNALIEKFTREGFAVLEAQNGEEGLDSALAKHPDMILLDIIMPVMDGIAMLKKLREDAWGKDAKVIMLTNLSDAEKVSEAMENKSFDYFVKTDIKLEDVVAMVKQRLGLSGRNI